MKNIMIMTLVAFVLAPHTFADESLESGGELQRVEEPGEGEQVAQETSEAGEGSESEAVDEQQPIGDQPASE